MGVIFLLMAGTVLLIMDMRAYVTKLDGSIERNPSGKGKKIQELEADIEGGKGREPVEVEIQERQYTSAEIKEQFSLAADQMERWILGDNKSLDRIEDDMDLIQSIPGKPIQVEWELDRYDVMNVYGELNEKELEKEGRLVNLKAVLTYKENPKEQALYACTAMVYPKTLKGAGRLAQEIKDAIARKEEKTRTKKSLKLPDAVDGRKVSYYEALKTRGIVLMVMAVLIGILLYALEKQNTYKEEKQKRFQMLLDYPELINKFTLLLGAGMTVRNTWRKMVQDYERQKEEWGIRYAYEEMKVTLNEMQSGITEAESYERFGRRCKTQEYVKFGALLSQNLRKGTKGLVQMLKVDAAQAFEERKARAKRLGEEAGTKLLLPMFLMLAVVLVIVIVPAFLSMRI